MNLKESNIILESSRLKLIPMEKEHASSLFRLWSNPNVVRYTYIQLQKNINEAIERVDHSLKVCNSDDNIGIFSIILKDKVIGCIGVPPISKENNEYGLFYQLEEEYWGNGYVYESADLIIKYMFNKRKAKKIHAEVVPNNIASLKILEKLGMSRIGIKHRVFKRDENILDIYEYYISNEEWRSHREKEIEFFNYINTCFL